VPAKQKKMFMFSIIEVHLHLYSIFLISAFVFGKLSGRDFAWEWPGQK